jgi:tetratricopeptide (TPR) repeat protein
MFGFDRPFARALAIATMATGVASAQGAQKSCDVNESRPTSLGRASLAVMTASSSPTPDAAKKQLVTAMKQLASVPANTDNPAGKGFVYGKALVLWASQPGIGLSAKRGAIGLTDNPDGMIDLATALDSSFKVLETAMPECVSETAKWRGQKPWVDMVNKAIERLNADDADSAAYAAQMAITLNPFAPYGFVVLANVRQRQQKTSEAFVLYRKSVDLASKDTAYDDIRRQSLVYLGTLAVDSAESTTDAAARKPYVDQARSAFEAILADKGAGESAGNARQGLCRVAIASGDTASLRTTYKDPLEKPETFSYPDLMNAGVCMARAEMSKEAAQLFTGAYDKNPYHRDVLSNLAIVLLRENQHERAVTLTSRLVSVEPNNPENLQLQVLAYAGIAQRSRAARLAGNPPASTGPTKAGTKAPPGTKAPGTKAPAATTPAAPRISAAATDSLFKIEKAYTDSAVNANGKKDSLQVRVQLSDFTASKDKATISGSAVLSSTVKAPDGTYSVKVDFLDAKGGVVIARDTAIALTQGKTGRFKLEGKGANIAAFRYTISGP